MATKSRPFVRFDPEDMDGNIEALEAQLTDAEQNLHRLRRRLWGGHPAVMATGGRVVRCQAELRKARRAQEEQ